MEPIDSSLLAADSSPALSVDELGKQIVDLAGRLAAATSRWLVLVAEFDAREGYLQFGLASSAQWLTHTCGIAHRTAVEQVRVSRSLMQFPRLATEMAEGRLSYSQTRAISRVAELGGPREAAQTATAGEPAEPAEPAEPSEPALVDDLIEVARYGTAAQLEVIVRGLRTVHNNESPTRPAEYVTRSWTEASQWRMAARLDPERGVRMAEIALVALADDKDPPRGLRGDERAAVVIHLDAARVQSPPAPAAVARSAEREPAARIAGGPGLPDRVVERLACAGRVRTVVHDGADNLFDVGRSPTANTGR